MDIAQWYETLAATDKVFLYSALFGGGVFLVRTLLMVVGGVGDHDIGHDISSSGGDDLDGGTDSVHDHGDDSIDSFHLLTVQGVTAFFMMGGLSGMFFSQQLQLGNIISSVCAAGIGVGAMYGCAFMVKLLLSLQSDGTLNLTSSLYKEGVVYLTVKPGTGGKVEIEVQEQLGVYDAITEGEEELKTGERVVVTRIMNGTTLVVCRSL